MCWYHSIRKAMATTQVATTIREKAMSDMKAVPDQGNGWIILSLDAEPGLFFELSDRRGLHHATFFEPLKGPNAFTVGDRVPITCMFDVNWLIHDERRVGLLFQSSFHVKNGG